MDWRASITVGKVTAHAMWILMACMNAYADKPLQKQTLVLEKLPPGESPPSTLPKWQSFLTPEGQWRIFKMTDGQSAGWSIPSGRILWAGILTEEAGQEAKSGLMMIGQLTEAEAAIEEVVAVRSKPGKFVVPVGQNLAKYLEWTPFGIEERVTFCQEEDPSCWQMQRGTKPAGIYSALPWRLPKWPVSSDWTLSIRLQGTGRVEVGLSVDFGKGAGEPQILSSVKLTDQAQRQQWKIPQKWLKAESLRLTLAGEPSLDTQVQIQEILCEPVLPTKQRLAEVPLKLGVWDWSTQPSLWKEKQELWKKAKVSVLQLALPRAWQDAEISAQIQKLQSDGFEIKIVEGDPHMVLPDEQASVINKNKLLNEHFQRSFDAVQYDVEPYILPGFRSESERWYRQWSGLFQQLHSKDRASVEAVVPFWLLNQPQGPSFLRELAKSVSRVVVMNYRTDHVESTSWASAWLEWSAESGCAVSLALECGPIPDLPLRLFKPAETGHLWVQPCPGLGTLAVYYADKVGRDPELPDALIMNEIRQTSVPGQRTTWHDRPAEDVLAMLEELRLLATRMKLPTRVQPEFLLHEPSADLIRFLGDHFEVKK